VKRYHLFSSFPGVALSAKIAFSERAWPCLAACVVPWPLCAGRRCVSRLAALGTHRRSESGYYRFLSDGRWRRIARDPKRPKRVAYLVTTDLALGAVAVVEAFARRWTTGQMFSVAKNRLGFDSAEVRKERSVLRHAALALALITWVEVWVRTFRPSLSARPFAAKSAAVREGAVMQPLFASGPRRKGSREIAATLARLFSAATRAAYNPAKGQTPYASYRNPT